MKKRPTAMPLALAFAMVLGSLAQGEAPSAEAEKAAMADGGARLRELVLQTPLDRNYTVGALLKRLQRENGLDGVLRKARAEGGTRWVDSRNCQVKLLVDGAALADQLVAVATEAADPQVDPRWVRQVTGDWPRREFSAIGSSCPAPAAQAPGARSLLPEQPPQWVFGLADAEATAKSAERPLKTARLAERQATEALRQQVRGLEVSPQVTLGALADRNPAIARAVEAGLRCARVYKTEYRADGSVLVRISLNLRLLWSELDAAR